LGGSSPHCINIFRLKKKREREEEEESLIPLKISHAENYSPTSKF
jgi:hypothetical protein